MPRRSGWFAVVADVPAELEDGLVAVGAAGALGAEFSPGPSDRGRLRVFTGSETTAAAVAQRLRSALGAAGVDPRDCGLRVEPVADDRWVERYQAGLRPFELTPRFVVDPQGGPTAQVPDKTTIALVPGRAFGTGEHETTRLCAAALERCVAPRSSWLDLGCGSGILCVVARACGAGEVRGVDVDPQAIDVARRVLEANGIAADVELRVGSLAGLAGRRWDGIVANIEAGFFRAEAPALAAALRPGGLLLASGLLEQQAGEVAAALGAAGLDEVGRAALGGWCLLELAPRGRR